MKSPERGKKDRKEIQRNETEDSTRRSMRFLNDTRKGEPETNEEILSDLQSLALSPWIYPSSVRNGQRGSRSADGAKRGSAQGYGDSKTRSDSKDDRPGRRQEQMG